MTKPSPLITQELDKYLHLVQQLYNKKEFFVKKIDDYGISLFKKDSDAKTTDLMITALTHGNEVIGLQTVNLILEKLIEADQLKYNLTILLNNVDAYKNNSRYIERDLNRCFVRSQTLSLESKRASVIQNIIKNIKPNLILDLHQTSAETLSTFFIMPEVDHLIRASYRIESNWPIICFDANGFSKDGQTLTEFAKSLSIPAIVIEISQNGFDLSKAQELCDKIYYLNIDNVLVKKSFSDIKYYSIAKSILRPSHEFELIPGLKNLQTVLKGQILGSSADLTPYESPIAGLLLFPKYGDIVEGTTEMGFIATPKTLKVNS